MIRLVPTWNITPKDGVAEKFDVNKNKKWNIFFGVLEFSNIYTLVMIIINLFRRHAEHVERTADMQFFFRLLFFIPSFGLLLKIDLLVKNSVFYTVLAIICLILEICRFILSIFIVHESRRYCGKQ